MVLFVSAMPKGAPHFSGDSYLSIDPLFSLNKRNGNIAKRRREIDFLFINFSTAYPDGMLLWSAQVNRKNIDNLNTIHTMPSVLIITISSN